MQLLLFRHGIAEDHGPDGGDASRRLTPEGVEKTAQAVRGLASIIDPPDAILASPKVRAVQTAQILGEALGPAPIGLAALAGGSIPRILAALGERREDSIILVGHEPTLSHLAAELCTGAAADFIEMKKAGCICLEVARATERSVGMGRLMWIATPRILRAIAGAD